MGSVPSLQPFSPFPPAYLALFPPQQSVQKGSAFPWVILCRQSTGIAGKREIRRSDADFVVDGANLRPGCTDKRERRVWTPTFVSPGTHEIPGLPGSSCPQHLGQKRDRELRKSKESRYLKACQKHQTNQKPGCAFLFHRPIFPLPVEQLVPDRTIFRLKRFPPGVNCKT
jgi:hypothetical protein